MTPSGNRSRGGAFTLIELLIYVALLALLLSIVGGLVRTGVRDMRFETGRIGAAENARRLFRALESDASVSVGASVEAGGDLVFVKADGGRTTWTRAGTTVRRAEKGGTRILALKVARFDFALEGDRVVRVRFVPAGAAAWRTPRRAYETAVFLGGAGP